GGAVEAVPYMKAALVDSHRARIRRIESGEQVVVGQNRFTESEPSPLTAGGSDRDHPILVVDPALEAEQVAAVRRWRAERDRAAVEQALASLAAAARAEDGAGNLMVPTIAAARAGASGMDVVYEGIRLTPAQIAASALQEGVHVIGLSILSGSHRELIPAVIDALREAGVTAPVVVGGIIPEQDVPLLQDVGVSAVYTPKDFDITRIMHEMLELVRANGSSPNGSSANGSA